MLRRNPWWNERIRDRKRNGKTGNAGSVAAVCGHALGFFSFTGHVIRAKLRADEEGSRLFVLIVNLVKNLDNSDNFG